MPRNNNNNPDPLDFEIVHKIEQQAERQLDLALKNVDALKDTDFYTFVSQLSRERFHYGWPEWIFNREETPPTEDELAQLKRDAVHDTAALKQVRSIKNAYLLI